VVSFHPPGKKKLTATASNVHNWTVIFFQDSHIGEILINENVIIFFWNKALELTAEAETLMLTLAF